MVAISMMPCMPVLPDQWKSVKGGRNYYQVAKLTLFVKIKLGCPTAQRMAVDNLKYETVESHAVGNCQSDLMLKIRLGFAKWVLVPVA
jgi:hypothetical protein